ncbi:Hypothetical predicted protein [Marmota monax]|uniref:Uncharacterized protein n=1 Tax=Marmota monax TaxID=9995 RepID=A0A5E4AEP2_MARMO|nr:Hypothetical predicted protein [Marmota monax]
MALNTQIRAACLLFLLLSSLATTSSLQQQTGQLTRQPTERHPQYTAVTEAHLTAMLRPAAHSPFLPTAVQKSQASGFPSSSCTLTQTVVTRSGPRQASPGWSGRPVEEREKVRLSPGSRRGRRV